MADYPTQDELELRRRVHTGNLASYVQRLADDVDAFRRGMEAMAEIMATRSDVDDLRAEVLGAIAEATATPFDSPEAA